MTDYFLYLTLLAYFGATGLWLAYFLAQREGYYRAGAWVMAGGLACHTLALIQRAWVSGLPARRHLRRGPAVVRLGPGGGLSGPDLALPHQDPGGPGGAAGGPDGVRGPDPAPAASGAVSPLLKGFWLTVHICLTLTGYAALALAGLGGILYLIQERQIKSKNFGFFYRRLPSLSQLDNLNYWCLTIGFPLLTGGIISGSLYAQHTLGRFWSAGTPRRF